MLESLERIKQNPQNVIIGRTADYLQSLQFKMATTATQQTTIYFERKSQKILCPSISDKHNNDYSSFTDPELNFDVAVTETHPQFILGVNASHDLATFRRLRKTSGDVHSFKER